MCSDGVCAVCDKSSTSVFCARAPPTFTNSSQNLRYTIGVRTSIEHLQAVTKLDVDLVNQATFVYICFIHVETIWHYAFLDIHYIFLYEIKSIKNLYTLRDFRFYPHYFGHVRSLTFSIRECYIHDRAFARANCLIKAKFKCKTTAKRHAQSPQEISVQYVLFLYFGSFEKRIFISRKI